MQKFSVTGMSCAACQTRVEKAVSKIKGVSECSVSLLTNSMGVEGDVNPQTIIKAVEKAGYGATLLGSSSNSSEKANPHKESQEDLLSNKEIPLLKKRLFASLTFLTILMYVSMGHTMWNWPLPAWFTGNHIAMGLLQMILAAIILLINKKFFISGVKSLLHGAPNMDTLVALGSGVSFCYSVVVLFLMTDAVIKVDTPVIISLMHNFYFESSAMIVTLITVGKLLEAISKGKTTSALKSLIALAPKTAIILKNGIETEVAIEEVTIGDIFVVRPGENIPVDGIVIEGSSAVNESALTGESIPVDKNPGSSVSAATINTSGFLKCQATRIGQDTTLSKIIQMVSDAAATKAPIAKIADKVSGIFVPAILGLSALTFAIWLLIGLSSKSETIDFAFALSRAIAVLVVSCPCALGLATPVAIMVGNGVGAKNGILFKNSESLEQTGKTQIVALDKTGTITLGKPEVVEIWNNNLELVTNLQDSLDFLKLAVSIENQSEHPLAKAIVKFGKENGIEPLQIEDFKASGGLGVSGKVLNQNEKISVFGGNLSFIMQKFPEFEKINVKNTINQIAQKGQTPLLFSTDKEFLGIISVADVIKPEAAKAVEELKNLGIKVVMLTGDNKITANAIAQQTGIENIIAEVLPDGKEEVIRNLKNEGKVTMVGDGINDAPALTRADIGIAIGAGSDIAIDAANVVLVNSRLEDVPAAIRLSRKTLTNIKENLFWAFFYNLALIPIAAGAYYFAFGLKMNPMFGAAAMSLSSFCVVSNALRLNLLNIRKSRFDKKNKLYKESNMEKTIKVEGMMCGHCEAHVKEALEAIKGITSATADHTTGEVKIVSEKEINTKKLEKAVTKAGYKFLG